MDENRLNQLALHCIPGIGSVTIRQLIAYCGSAEAVWHRRKKQLLSIPGVGPATYTLLNHKKEAFDRAEQIVRKSSGDGSKIIFHSDEEFPSRLRHICDAPSLLFMKGKGNLNPDRTLAIVGTRQATGYGLDQTHQLLTGLANYDPQIISGLAYGIDIRAHRTALNQSLSTVAVLAGGLDYIYPADHEIIARRMTEKGALLSEHPPGTMPEAHRFPARNRIIAGMADGVLVTEARDKGGALITARLANDYNREVFALPGSVNAASSAGCHLLIKRNQAHLITSCEDIINILGWSDGGIRQRVISVDEESLPVAERRIYAFLKSENASRSMDQISWTTNLTIHETATALLQLEFKGLIRAMPGKQYQAS